MLPSSVIQHLCAASDVKGSLSAVDDFIRHVQMLPRLMWIVLPELQAY